MSKWLRLSIATVAMMMLASVALAAPGVNLLWGNCATGAGVQNKTFACASNTLTGALLVGSYIPPAGITTATGMEVVIDLLTPGPNFTDWWAFKNVGTCRTSSLSADVNFTGGPFDCTDYWQGGASGGITAYIIGYASTANRARLLLIYAVPGPAATALDSNLEYYGFKLNINGAKTVGTGSCAGCADPVCVVLNSIKITQPLGSGDFVISDEATSRTATWQGASAATCLPVPARNRTWGSVKSLYR